MKVSVFGSARPLPGDPTYELAYQLGKRLGEKGHTVLNGGYFGTMDAVSRGASEAGAQVIGVTCDEIERWREVKPSTWITQEVRHSTLYDRIAYMVVECDAAVAVPGGLGTLAEISLMWNQVTIAAVPQKPIFLLGDGWKTVFDAMSVGLGSFVKPEDWHWLRYVPSIDSVIEELERL